MLSFIQLAVAVVSATHAALCPTVLKKWSSIYFFSEFHGKVNHTDHFANRSVKWTWAVMLSILTIDPANPPHPAPPVQSKTSILLKWCQKNERDFEHHCTEHLTSKKLNLYQTFASNTSRRGWLSSGQHLNAKSKSGNIYQLLEV